MKPNNSLDNIIQDPIINKLLKKMFEGNNYFYTLLWAFTTKWRFDWKKFEKFLTWIQSQIDKWGIFSIQSSSEKNNLDIFFNEVSDYLEKMAVDEWIDLSDELLKKKVFIDLKKYLYWRIEDIDTIENLNKLFS